MLKATTLARIAAAFVAASAGLGLTAAAAHGAQAKPGPSAPVDYRVVHLPTVLAAPYAAIGNYHSSKCLDVPGYSTTKGTWLDQWTCTGHSNQKWKMINQLPDGAFQIINQHSRQCLSVKGNSKSNGAHIIQWSPCRTADTAEDWLTFRTNIRNYYVFEDIGTDTCMQVNGASQSNRAKISAWECFNELSRNKPLPHHFYWSWADL
jgi:Ricin-type beta-trefoil lectin domain-like